MDTDKANEVVNCHPELAGESEPSPAAGLDPERLARVFLTLAAKHTGLEEADYNEEDMAYFRQEAEEIAAEYDCLSRSGGEAR